jgi:glycerol-3-phosphate dehydrogenase
VPAGQVEASMDQTAESLATVPLLADAFEREGIEAPITTGLRRVLDGETSPEQWLETVRSTRPARRRTHAA